MVYMLNETSLTHRSNLQEAHTIMENFVKACIMANRMGFTELRLYELSLSNLYDIPLVENYSIDTWLNDKNTPTDLKERFREIVTSFPLIRKEELKEYDIYSASEFFMHVNSIKQQVWGLGAAYIHDTLSISLDTGDIWKSQFINIHHYSLNEENEEKTENINVRHFINNDTLNSHSEWWLQKQIDSLTRISEFWNKKGELFPNLIFCIEVERQILNLGVSKTFYQIIERLTALDKFVTNWNKGNFDYDELNKKTNLRASPESDITLQKFGASRKFTIPNQGKKLFSLHIKTGDLRFYFYPDTDSKKVYIGYIGKHLRIASQD